MRRQITDDLDCIGKGWRERAILLHHQLRSEDPDYRLGQMKEKWGALRVYIDTPMTPMMHHYIYEAELDSERLCEDCGAAGRVSNINGWWYALCDDCYHSKRGNDDRATS